MNGTATTFIRWFTHYRTNRRVSMGSRVISGQTGRWARVGPHGPTGSMSVSERYQGLVRTLDIESHAPIQPNLTWYRSTHQRFDIFTRKHLLIRYLSTIKTVCIF